MKCPNCSKEDSKVVDSRSIHEGGSIRRRRECNKCEFRFTTYEYILINPVKVIKKSGDREEYDRSKLEKSFNIACKKRPIPEEKIQQAIHNIEEKIIFGLANSNSAYAHNSIWLNTISLFFLPKNNFNFLTLPSYLIYNLFIIFSLKNILKLNNQKISNYFLIIQKQWNLKQRLVNV